MSREDLFPDAHRPGQDARVEAAWDLSWPLPVPRFPMVCPGCGGVLVLKDWKFHTRANTGSKSPWRCDVRLKCIGCSYVPIYGIPVPRRLYDAACALLPGQRFSQWLSWREGKAALAAAGFFDTR